MFQLPQTIPHLVQLGNLVLVRHGHIIYQAGYDGDRRKEIVGYVREVTQLGLCQFLTLLLFYLYDFNSLRSLTR